MKGLATVFGIVVVATMACGRQGQAPGKTTQMMLADSASSGENITPVRPKEAVHPVESIAAFDKLPNIMQSDIDAKQRTPSQGVIYVKLGDPARPAEKRE